ncbi:MAG: carboxypeptidase regulatory-like domain-containing protein [Candidatus Zixiibacteriota bacterium]|nr:MAG: carboxypeptidase regulatory-like domain-containing protein [candidate division Zixibacteria bacterium]
MEVVGDTIIYRLNGQMVAVMYRAWDEKIPQALVELKGRFESDSLRAKGYVLKEEYQPIRNTKGEVFLAIGYNVAYIVDTSAVLGIDDSDTMKVETVRNRAGEVFIRGGRQFEVVYVLDGASITGPTAGLDQAGANLTLFEGKRRGRIAGRITDAETGEPKVGTRVTDAGSGLGVVTDTSGKYQLSLPEPGTYTVQIEHPDYQTVTVRNVLVKADIITECSQDVKKRRPNRDTAVIIQYESDKLIPHRLPDGVNIDANTLRSGPGPSAGEMLAVTRGRIVGKITDASSGEAIRNVSVIVVGTVFRTLTDSKGHFQLEDIPNGSYEIIFSCKGYRTIKVHNAHVDLGYTKMVTRQLQRKEQEE